MTSRLYKMALVVLVLYWVAIFIATHTPAGPRRAIQMNDKLQHMAAYFVLSVLLHVTLGAKLRGHTPWVSLLVVMVYGAIDEGLQPLVGRSAEMMDWMADAAGAAIGVCLCGLVAAVLGRLRRNTGEKDPVCEDALR